MNKEFKVVLAGDFGSGRTTYLNQFVAAKRGRSKVGESSSTLADVEWQ
jgi:GTPase SAR1 family protein